MKTNAQHRERALMPLAVLLMVLALSVAMTLAAVLMTGCKVMEHEVQRKTEKIVKKELENVLFMILKDLVSEYWAELGLLYFAVNSGKNIYKRRKRIETLGHG